MAILTYRNNSEFFKNLIDSETNPEISFKIHCQVVFISKVNTRFFFWYLDEILLSFKNIRRLGFVYVVLYPFTLLVRNNSRKIDKFEKLSNKIFPKLSNFNLISALLSGRDNNPTLFLSKKEMKKNKVIFHYKNSDLFIQFDEDSQNSWSEGQHLMRILIRKSFG